MDCCTCAGWRHWSRLYQQQVCGCTGIFTIKHIMQFFPGRIVIFSTCLMPDLPAKESYLDFFESVHLFLSEWQLIPAWQDPLSLISTSKVLVPWDHNNFPGFHWSILCADLQGIFDCNDWFQPQIDRRCDKWLNTWSLSSNLAINAWYWNLVISSTTL